jgi:hypothetical protein
VVKGKRNENQNKVENKYMAVSGFVSTHAYFPGVVLWERVPGKQEFNSGKGNGKHRL